jgi:hypothetical protein
MSSLSIFENEIIPFNCGIKKILPAERLMTFSILHYYSTFDPNFPSQNSHPVFISDQHIKHGYMQMKHPVVKAGYFQDDAVSSCWGPIIKKYEQKFNDKVPEVSIITTSDVESHSSTSTSTTINSNFHHSDSISNLNNHNNNKLSSDIMYLLKAEDEHVLVKQKNTIYLIENGRRRMIPSRKVFEDHGFNWDKVINSADMEGFHELPVGSDLS